jgi:type IV secretory pathway VirB10-like protein
VLAEWTEYHPEQTTDAEMQELGSDFPPAPPLPTDIEGLLGRHFAALKEGYDASLANLVKIVLELTGTVKKLSAQNGELLVRLKGLEAKSPRTTAVSHGVTQTSPPPRVANSATQALPAPPPPPVTATAKTPAAPPVATKSKRKRCEPSSPAQQPTKHAREISPPPSLMHSKHAGPSDALVSVRPTPGTRDAPAPSAPRDEAEAKEGWKKVERKKRRRPSGRTAAQSAGKSVPSWAQVAGDGAVCFNFYIGGGAGNTKPRTARRPQGGKKKEKGKEKEQRAPRV